MLTRWYEHLGYCYHYQVTEVRGFSHGFASDTQVIPPQNFVDDITQLLPEDMAPGFVCDTDLFLGAYLTRTWSTVEAPSNLLILQLV